MATMLTRAVLPLALALALLGGCSSAKTSASDGYGASGSNGRVPGVGALPADSTTQTKTDGSLPQTPVIDGPQITRSATMTVVVPDEAVAATRLRAIATSHGGVVTTENVVSGGEKALYAVSTVVLSVPADQLDTTLNDIRALGEVTLRTIESSDVSAKVADVDSRIQTMRTSIARIQDLLTRAGSITEIAQVESELTRRQSDLESLLAQQKVLAQRVAQSPVTVTLTRVAVVETPPVPATGFLAGLRAGWHALVVFGTGLLTVIGAMLPFLAVLGLVAGPVVWLLGRRRASRPKGRTAQAPATGQDSAAS
jgi:hypothetical protein